MGVPALSWVLKGLVEFRFNFKAALRITALSLCEVFYLVASKKYF